MNTVRYSPGAKISTAALSGLCLVDPALLAFAEDQIQFPRAECEFAAQNGRDKIEPDIVDFRRAAEVVWKRLEMD